MAALPSAFKWRADAPLPWEHQERTLVLTWDVPCHALTWEQGTGKTRLIIETAACLFLSDRIEALIVAAPNGVQRGWVRDEIPKYMPTAINYRAMWFNTNWTKKFERQLEEMARPSSRFLRILTINYDLLITKRAQTYLGVFLEHFRSLLVGDESHKFKNVKATRSKVMVNLGKLADYRRIMTGTPTSVGPLDVYNQYQFLSPSILNSPSFVAFKAHHSVLVGKDDGLMRHIMTRLVAKYGRDKAEKMRPQLIARDPLTNRPLYRNVEELNRKIAPFTTRVLKSECLDLPPKIYQKRYVTLTDEQRRIYNQMRDDYLVDYRNQLITAPLAIVRITRLQQIIGGFLATDDGEQPIGESNPKLEALLDLCEDADGKVLIWARFTVELQLIAAALEEEYGAEAVARYWGEIKTKDRDNYKAAFINDPRCRFFVSQQKAGGTGLDGLQVASLEIYYSNEISLIDRIQSEDRAHRGGSERHETITLVDIVAEDTLDNKFLETLRENKNIADLITGDDPREWL